VKTKTDEMDAEERTKKTNDLIEKFKKMPLSNRSTPRSSQHNSRESLDVLSSRESLNSHSYKVNFEVGLGCPRKCPLGRFWP